MSSGRITQALEEAVEMRAKLIADGMAPTEADRLVGKGLKDLLGNPRATPWKFYCETCRDTGWINIDLPVDEIARLTKLYGEGQAQGYVVKCEPCKWNQLEREKRRKKAAEDYDPDDLAAAGQTKSRGFRKAFGK